MTLLSIQLFAQEQGQTAIPLDHFYAKPIHGSSAFRRILKDFHFGAFSGLGRTYFNNNLNKFRAFNIPLGATLHYQKDRFRVGGGYSYELITIGRVNANAENEKPSGLERKYWGMLGVSFYRWNDLLLTGDMQVGSYKLKPATSTFFNLGVTVEKDLSEYFKVYARPYYEIKSYNVTPSGSANSVHYNANALGINIGFTYSIPELPRCFLRDCHAQINHAHGNREYRSRKHPIYKKQNPGYGENDPILLKYKGKNKKKLDPY